MKNRLIKKLSNEFKEIQQTMDEIDYWNSFKTMLDSTCYNKNEKNMKDKQNVIQTMMIHTSCSEDECKKWLDYMNGDVFKAEKVLIDRNRKQMAPPKIEKIDAHKDKNSMNDIWMELHLMNIKMEEILKALNGLSKKL
jgi:hypothetical protein